MKSDNERFEAIRLLADQYCDYCVVYCFASNGEGMSLRWRKVACRYDQSYEGREKVASENEEVAAYCYEHKIDMSLKEERSTPGTSGPKWRGFEISPQVSDTSEDPRDRWWWRAIVASGPIRDAGYVIVFRIPAGKVEDVRKFVGEVNSVWSY